MQKFPFELHANEKIIRDEFGVLILGGLKNRMGRVFLSNQRIVFTKTSPLFGGMFGIIGVLLERLFENRSKPIAFELPLSKIIRFEHGSFGLNKKIIFFHAQDGQIHKIGTTNAYAEWEDDLKKILKK